MTTIITDATIGEIIDSAAHAYGVDPVLAEVIAWNESGFDTNAAGDWTTGGIEGPFVAPHTPGSRPTSFGLYQLHEGGELGSLSEAEAYNPITNAHTALAHVGAVAKLQPADSPGQLAANAQGPGDPAQYIAIVNDLYTAVKGGNFPPGWAEKINVKTGLTVVNNTPTADPPATTPPVAPAIEKVSVALPEFFEGVGMPPHEPLPAVAVVQRLIGVPADGQFGPITSEGLATFQSHHGLAITRKTDEPTWLRLLEI